MIPSSLTLYNFRSFARPEGVELELRPLTLLYGLNNAGKSSLARSLPLLADSMGYDGLDAFNVEGRLKPFDLDFDSLRWKGRKETDEHTIRLSLRWDDARICEIEWTLWEEPTWHRTVVKSFVVRGAKPTPLYSAAWVMTRGQEAELALSYDVTRSGDPPTRESIVFQGLLPEPTPAGRDPLLDEAHARLSSLSSSVLWVRSNREGPQRFTRWRGAVRWSLEPDGRDASVVLAGEDDVRAEVSSWYQDHLDLDLVVQESRKREVQTMLRNRVRAGFDIDLADAGEGLRQCLPVLTALAMVRHHREHDGPSIVSIEEPEAHLHPNLQRALAERACQVAADTRPKIVLETHSEHVLLAVRLQIVKRLLKPEDVVLYWVKSLPDGSSLVDRIELDADGRFVGNWPPEAFQQDVTLAADIQDELDGRGSP